MVAVGSNWLCPYCGHAQVISEARRNRIKEKIAVAGWVHGLPGFFLEAIVCANQSCAMLSLNLDVVRRQDNNYNQGFEIKERFKAWTLLPSSNAKPFPDYIPKSLKDDYEEACAIRNLSPKASATLIRRCIQGIIRDFCGIKLKDNRLISEVLELSKRVSEGKAPSGVLADTVQAIDDIRKIGNIGAHMEANIDIIIDVDPMEAQTLIELAEMLFTEWYVEREKRQQRIESISGIRAIKDAAKKSASITE